MNRATHSIWRYMGYGAFSGLLLLGLTGRFAMVGLALLLGYPTNLSVVSVVLVTLIGTVYGAAGGLLYHALMTWGVKRRRGLITAAVLFVVSLLFLRPQPGVSTDTPHEQLVALLWTGDGPALEGELIPIRIAVLAVVALLYLAYGLLLERLLLRGSSRPAPV